MILHDPQFETLATAPIKTTDVQVARQLLTEDGFVDDTPAWASSDLLMEVKIDVVGQMLGAATKKAVVKLLSIVNGIEIGTLYQIRLGLYDNAESEFNYVSQGFFTVDTVDYDYEAGSTTVTLYDAMWRAGKMLYTENVTIGLIEYPVTVEGLATVMADIMNVQLMDDFSDLPNSQYEIPVDLYETINGATIQNVIQDIAGATGTTARVTDYTLVFSQYDPTSENLDSESLKKLKIGETYGPVTSVILGRTPQNDNIAIYASSPFTNTVTNVNTSTNLLTIEDHAMEDGNMISFESTGTLPSPLVAGVQYYIFADGDPDTFALAPTYDDAIVGTNLIDITTAGSGTITVPNIVTKEIQINNNQIVDDDRESLIAPLYNKLSGIYWADVKSDTVGLGWHEVGDVISFTQGSTTVRAFINEIHLTLSGSLKESLVSQIPALLAIDYQAAGGIQKSIYNTEIKVDKQENDITSIVSRQDFIEGEINTNFSQIYQDVDEVTITVQNAGGGNLLLNSVGFAREQTPDNATPNPVNYPKLLSWDYPDDYVVADMGSVSSYDSSESQNFGGVSGRVIEIATDYLEPQTMYISQRVNVAVGKPLSFAMRINNALGMGTATITLENENETFTLEVDDDVNHIWEEISIVNFVVTQPWLVVTIEATAAKFMFTDLRLMYASTLPSWVQANGEILSANVQFTKDGMRIFDESHDTETRVTYNEFSTRSRTDGAILFEADDTGVVTNDLKIKGSTSYVRDDLIIIKQITIAADNPKAGIAFVKGSDV